MAGPPLGKTCAGESRSPPPSPPPSPGCAQSLLSQLGSCGQGYPSGRLWSLHFRKVPSYHAVLTPTTCPLSRHRANFLFPFFFFFSFLVGEVTFAFPPPPARVLGTRGGAEPGGGSLAALVQVAARLLLLGLVCIIPITPSGKRSHPFPASASGRTTPPPPGPPALLPPSPALHPLRSVCCPSLPSFIPCWMLPTP